MRPRGLQEPVHRWSIEDVCEWLGLHNLGRFAPTFQSNGIDGPSLLDLTKQDLKEELDIERLQDRKEIWGPIEEIQIASKEGHPPPLPGAPYSAVQRRSIDASVPEQATILRTVSPPPRRTPSPGSPTIHHREVTHTTPGNDDALGRLTEEQQALEDLMGELQQVNKNITEDLTSHPLPVAAHRNPTPPPQHDEGPLTAAQVMSPSLAAMGKPPADGQVRSSGGDGELGRALNAYSRQTGMVHDKVNYSQLLNEQAAAQDNLWQKQQEHEELLKRTGFR